MGDSSCLAAIAELREEAVQCPPPPTLPPTLPPVGHQVGESPRLTAIAELLEEAVQREHRRGTVIEARKILHLVDKEVCGVGVVGVVRVPLWR